MLLHGVRSPPPRPGTSQLTAKSYAHCNTTQRRIIAAHFQHYKDVMAPVTAASSPHGGWLSSCPGMHCQTGFDATVKVGGLSVGEAAGRWYFEHDAVKLVDVAFPGNPTCPGSPGSVNR